jgi:hypothetical protein
MRQLPQIGAFENWELRAVRLIAGLRGAWVLVSWSAHPAVLCLSLPAGGDVKLIARYEIFEKSGARQIAWLESTTSLGHARCRLKQLTIACSGICFFAFDVENERFVVRSNGNSEDGNRGIAGALKTGARGNSSVETT